MGTPSDPWEPLGLNLTWQGDPATAITVDWHVESPDQAAELEFRVSGEGNWEPHGVAETLDFPFSPRYIHRNEVTGLQPDTEYEFRFGAQSAVYRFRTMPAENLHQPVRLVFGGDVRSSLEGMIRTAEVAMTYDPHAVVFGGDLAYANGDPRRVDRWYEWFETTRDVFRAPDGRIVPVIVAIGNHELWGTRRLDEDELHLEEEWGLYDDFPTYFTTIFPHPTGTSYRVVDVGNYLSLFLLDSDHLEDVVGDQTDWLEAALEGRTHVPHLIPVYHVPAYPSVRSFDGGTSTRIRENWSPLFEAHGVRVSFENHDHAYKRTFPIRGGEIDPAGVVYIGDGAWGVSPREIGRDHDEGAWYLKRAAGEHNFILATLHGPHQHFLMVDAEGNILDEYPQVLTRPGAGGVPVAERLAPLRNARP